jgi:hypothetical protein
MMVFSPGFFTHNVGSSMDYERPAHTVVRKSILTLLSGGDRRSIGRSDQVAALVRKHPELFPELIAGLWSADPIVRMRSADAAEKLSRRIPSCLQPFRKELLSLLAEATQQELRWHLALMVPRLALTAKEQQIAVSLLTNYLDDRSSIVKTCALQGLAGLAHKDPNLCPRIVDTLRQAARNGTPAMKARSRKLLFQLERP